MKIYNAIVLIFLAAFLHGCYEPEDTTPSYVKTTKEFGGDSLDFARKIIPANDGNYLILGETRSFGDRESDVYLVKVKENGDMIWEQTYGGEQYEEGHDIVEHPDGNYYIAGSTTSFGSGGADMMFIKVDAMGNQVLMKTYGGIYYDKAFFISLTSDNSLLTGGYMTNMATRQKNVNIRKLTTGGQQLWTSSYGSDTTDLARNAIDNGKGYVIIGQTTVAEENENITLTQLDYEGNFMWQRRFGGPGMDDMRDIVETGGGDYLMCGFSGNFYDNGNNDVYLLQTSPAGDSLLSSHYGNEGEADFEEGYGIIKAADGGYYISGRQKGAMLLLKANENLQITSQATYGDIFISYTAIGYDLLEKPDGSLIVVGGQPFSDNGDMLFLEVDPAEFE